MSKRKLYELKYELEDLKDANEKLTERLAMVIDELKELKTKMKMDEYVLFDVLIKD